MKRKTPVKLIGYLLCVALLCGLLAGCGNDKVQEEQNDNASADTIPEDVVVHTDYGDLHYPSSALCACASRRPADAPLKIRKPPRC